jgi:hypothetical protein
VHPTRKALKQNVKKRNRQHDGKPDRDDGEAVEICPAARAALVSAEIMAPHALHEVILAIAAGALKRGQAIG